MSTIIQTYRLEPYVVDKLPFGTNVDKRKTHYIEKRKAHYPLSEILALIEQDSYRFTWAATRGYESLEMSEDEALDVIRGLRSINLHKSMPTHDDYKVWQDVYKITIEGIRLYIKLQISAVTEFENGKTSVVISFKAADNY